jgi:hypothetical protein
MTEFKKKKWVVKKIENKKIEAKRDEEKSFSLLTPEEAKAEVDMFIPDYDEDLYENDIVPMIKLYETLSDEIINF